MNLKNVFFAAAAASVLTLSGSVLACDTCPAHAAKSAPSDTMPGKDMKKDVPATKAPAKATVGMPAPGFELMDTEGKKHQLSDYRGKIVVLEWYNPDCPFSGGSSDMSVHKRGTVSRTQEAAKKMDSEVVYLLINSTSNAPKDSIMKRSKESIEQWKMTAPVLVDYGGTVGKMYQAKTTPHMFVINGDGTLIYEGAFTDDRRGGKGGEEMNYVVNAMMAAQKGEACTPANVRPWGCRVRYPGR